jgi:hypothetical protein
MVCILYFSTALFENENEMNQLEKLLGDVHISNHGIVAFALEVAQHHLLPVEILG